MNVPTGMKASTNDNTSDSSPAPMELSEGQSVGMDMEVDIVTRIWRRTRDIAPFIIAIMLLATMSDRDAVADCSSVANEQLRNLCNNLETTFTKVSNEVIIAGNETLATVATGAKTTAVTVKNEIDTVYNTVQVAAGQLEGMTFEILQMIDDALEMMQYQIEFGAERYYEFVGGGNCESSSKCFQFRQDLIDLVENLQNLSNVLLSVRPASGAATTFPVVDLTLMKEYLGNLPAIALFPLHEAFAVLQGGTGIDFFPVLNGHLTDISTALETVLEIVKAPAVATPLVQGASSQMTTLDATEPQPPGGICELLIYDDFDSGYPVEIAITSAQALGGSIKTIGKFIEAQGTTVIKPEAQVHGYIGASFWGNLPQRFGKFLEFVGDTTSIFARIARSKQLMCEIEYARAIETATAWNTYYLRCMTQKNARGGGQHNPAHEECVEIANDHQSRNAN